MENIMEQSLAPQKDQVNKVTHLLNLTYLNTYFDDEEIIELKKYKEWLENNPVDPNPKRINYQKKLESIKIKTAYMEIYLKEAENLLSILKAKVFELSVGRRYKHFLSEVELAKIKQFKDDDFSLEFGKNAFVLFDSLKPIFHKAEIKIDKLEYLAPKLNKQMNEFKFNPIVNQEASVQENPKRAKKDYSLKKKIQIRIIQIKDKYDEGTYNGINILKTNAQLDVYPDVSSTDCLYSTFFSAGVWVYGVVVVDSTGCYIYKNGVLVDTGTKDSITDNNENLYIGQQDGQSRYWDGLIDEVKIYPFVLICPYL